MKIPGAVRPRLLLVVIILAAVIVGVWLVGRHLAHARAARARLASVPPAIPPAATQNGAVVPPVSMPITPAIPINVANLPHPDWKIPMRYHKEFVRRPPAHFPKKWVALTIDDGPDPKVTPIVLATLEKAKVHATFFVIGIKARAHPELLQQMIIDGDVIGLHTMTHSPKPDTDMASKELTVEAALVKQITGVTPTLFRPPYGDRKSEYSKVALSYGYPAMMWTIASADTKDGITEDKIIHNVTHTPGPGDIILIHDGGAEHIITAEALPTILHDVQALGYTFVTVPELLRAEDDFLNTEKKTGK